MRTFEPSTPEQQRIEAALARFGGDVGKAANYLGADLRTVYATWLRMERINGQDDGDGEALADRAALVAAVQAAKPERARDAWKEPTDTGACGTEAGYGRHERRSEKACRPCLDSRSAALRAREARRRAS